MVGVNRYATGEGERIPTLRIDEEVQRSQIEALREVKRTRDAAAVERELAAVRAAARAPAGAPGANLMPPIVAAAKAFCTQQELCDVLREELGTYSDPAEF
jgi:methylmalonyl-CoA mutase N-terminal domain/subunit